MKKQFIILAAILMVGITSCKEVDKLTHFNVPLSKSVPIPAIPSVGLNFPVKQSFTVQTDIENKFKEYNTSSKLVERIFLKTLEMELTAPEGGSLDFLKSIKVYIEAEGLSEVLIASKTNVPTPAGAKLELDIEKDLDLKQYILKDPITLSVEVVADQMTITESTVLISASFLVDAKILGI